MFCVYGQLANHTYRFSARDRFALIDLHAHLSDSVTWVAVDLHQINAVLGNEDKHLRNLCA